MGSVLVVGAGVAGIRAALDLAEVGHRVLLADASPAVGGILAKLDHQFPDDHCGMCQLLPELGEWRYEQLCLRRGLFHERVELLPSTAVTHIEGEPGAFRVELERRARHIDPRACARCAGPCIDVCPIELPDPFEERLGRRKAIDWPTPLQRSAGPCIDLRACDRCGACVAACPARAIDLDRAGEPLLLEVDAVIVAAGTEIYQPTGDPAAARLLVSPNVLTSLAFERLMGGAHADRERPGKRHAALRRPSDGKPARRIGWLQCVGSRDPKHGRPDCSSVCCAHALKEATLARAAGATETTIFYMDLRLFGKGLHRYRLRAEEQGVRMVRCRAHDVSALADGSVRVRYFDESTGTMAHASLDLLVLSTGQSRNLEAATRGWWDSPLGVSERGEAESTRRGVLLCGAVCGPADIAESVTSASAASSEACRLLAPLGKDRPEPRSKEPSASELVPIAQRALVVGGGVAGLTVAASLAERGVEVTLVERSAELGGRLAAHAGAVIGDPSAAGWLADLRRRVTESPRVTVQLNAEVVSSRGAIGAFETTIRAAGREHRVHHGATILATGGRSTATDQYGYGQSDRIVTRVELEDRLVAGRLELPSSGVVVMIQCVGSREEPRLYCSRVCCAAALRDALWLKARHAGLQIFVLSRDLMTPGPLERLAVEARAEGVTFASYDPHRRPTVRTGGDRPTVELFDAVLGRPVEIEADLVVLSTAIEPDPSATRLGRIFGVELDADGFFREANAKWRPVESTRAGVLLAGTAHSPAPLRNVVAQAEAAAQRAYALLRAPKVTVSHGSSWVHHAVCALCGLCISTCPHGARELDPGEDRIVVHPLACRACGLCAAACPSGAARVASMRDAEVMAAVDAALEDCWAPRPAGQGAGR